jgi:hypothetical protein
LWWNAVSVVEEGWHHYRWETGSDVLREEDLGRRKLEGGERFRSPWSAWASWRWTEVRYFVRRCLKSVQEQLYPPPGTQSDYGSYLHYFCTPYLLREVGG